MSSLLALVTSTMLVVGRPSSEGFTSPVVSFPPQIGIARRGRTTWPFASNLWLLQVGEPIGSDARRWAFALELGVDLRSSQAALLHRFGLRRYHAVGPMLWGVGMGVGHDALGPALSTELVANFWVLPVPAYLTMSARLDVHLEHGTTQRVLVGLLVPTPF